MIAGGVITDSEYADGGGSVSADGDGTVLWSRLSTLTIGVRGLIGVAESECRRYQANTVHCQTRKLDAYRWL